MYRTVSATKQPNPDKAVAAASQRARLRSAVIRDPRFAYLELTAMVLLAVSLWLAVS